MNDATRHLLAQEDYGAGLDRMVAPPGLRLTLRGVADILEGRLRQFQPEHATGMERAAVEDLATALDALRVVTEELEAQVEYLRRERERSTYLFEGAPFACLATDAGGNISEANRAAVAILGASPSRLYGKSLAGFVYPEDRALFRQRLAALARSGTDKWTQWNGGLVRDDGTAVGVAFDCRVSPLAPPASRVLWALRPTAS